MSNKNDKDSDNFETEGREKLVGVLISQKNKLEPNNDCENKCGFGVSVDQEIKHNVNDNNSLKISSEGDLKIIQ
jgi:hypothetical protein